MLRCSHSAPLTLTAIEHGRKTFVCWLLMTPCVEHRLASQPEGPLGA